jgi:hypothetical protein
MVTLREIFQFQSLGTGSTRISVRLPIESRRISHGGSIPRPLHTNCDFYLACQVRHISRIISQKRSCKFSAVLVSRCSRRRDSMSRSREQKFLRSWDLRLRARNDDVRMTTTTSRSAPSGHHLAS